MLIAGSSRRCSFVNQLFLNAPRLREFFEVLDTAPAVHDRPDATISAGSRGRVEFDKVSFLL